MRYHFRAINPDKNIDRFYKLDLSQDLFNTWTVRVTYGRADTQGRQRLFAFPSHEDANAFFTKKTKERLAFRKRRGCAYQLKETLLA